MEDLEFWHPLVSAVAFYVTVFAVAEVSRRVVSRLFAVNSTLYVFLIEFIGTAQMCTCVYENGIMFRYYGLAAGFFTVATLLASGSVLNRGAAISPLGPIEAFYYGIIPMDRVLTVVAAQCLGGMSAFRLATQLWYSSAAYSNVHYSSYVDPSCAINYKIDFPLVLAFEVLGCAFIRIVIGILPEKAKFISIPVLISTMISVALVFVGVPGLNPVVVSSRMFGCQGLDAQWFIALYWICPVIGWLGAASLMRRLSKTKVAKKTQKKKNN